jgi:tellurite resistance protein TerC
LVQLDLWHWLAFCGFVVLMLVLDLGVFHRDSRESSLRESAIWTIVWLLMALAFNGLVWYLYTDRGGPVVGQQKAAEFLLGYVIEWSLSMDNVFVFAVIFKYFNVPMRYQYRVLFWGILGAILMRLTFVLLGAAIIHQFHWVMYVLGAFLVYTGIQLSLHDDEVDPEKSWVLRLARRFFPVTKENHEERFFVVEAGRRCVTPLFLVLLVVETTDVAFAFDSVPAIFGITEDPFIVFTSNIFAILGLRALYFLLAGFMGLFQYLKYGLSAILVFVGLKMLVEFFGIHINHWLSLAIVLGLLVVSMLVSVIASRRGPKAPNVPSADDS